MKKLTLLFATVCLCVFTAMATDNRVSEERTIGDFKGIAVSTGINVNLLQGKASTIKVEAKNEEILEYVNTEISGGILKIGIKNRNGFNSFRNTGRIDVYVAADNIESLSTSSGSSTKTLTTLQTDNIDIDCSSGSSVNIDIKANNIKSRTSSGSSCRISGTTVKLTASASSGSSSKLEDLAAEEVDADASSGSTLRVNASKKISASASSGASVKWSGRAEIVKSSGSSGGSVRKM